MQARSRYSDAVELWFAAVLGSALLAAMLLLAFRIVASARDREKDERRIAMPGERSCPLCSSVLAPGERVRSKLFPGKNDRIMHIFGCVHCWPATVSAPRICPVCGQVLDAEGWVIARYFESPGRKHVHVLGCTDCRSNKEP